MTDTQVNDPWCDEQHEIGVEVIVPKDWYEFCTKYNDLFMTDHCGYWMRGVDHRRDDPTLGWLVWEVEDDEGFNFDCKMTEDEYHAPAIKAWVTKQPLPPKYHVLNKEAATRAYLAGCKMKGTDWYESADALDYDACIQMALLGEIKYG